MQPSHKNPAEACAALRRKPEVYYQIERRQLMKSNTKFILNTLLLLGMLAIIAAIAIPQFAAYRSSGGQNVVYNNPIQHEVEFRPTYTAFNTEAYD